MSWNLPAARPAHKRPPGLSDARPTRLRRGPKRCSADATIPVEQNPRLAAPTVGYLRSRGLFRRRDIPVAQRLQREREDGMDLAAGSRTARLQRLGMALILAATAAAITMAFAASAQAAPNVATAWGNHASGQLGDGTNTGREKCRAGQPACPPAPVAANQR